MKGYLCLQAGQGGEHRVELDDVQAPGVEALQDSVDGGHCTKPPVSHSPPLSAKKPDEEKIHRKNKRFIKRIENLMLGSTVRDSSMAGLLDTMLNCLELSLSRAKLKMLLSRNLDNNKLLS